MKIALFTNLDVIENNDNIFSVIKSLIKNKIEFEIDINSKISKSALQSANIEEDNIKNFVELNDSYDFAISVGGDGTILNSVEKIGELSIPIIGLNTGRLGFLANSSLKNIEMVINKLKNNDFNISKRSIIEVLFNGEKKYALNEITVSRKNTTSLITIEAKLNNQYLNTYWADGLIVSTPTGSTGYSLSCGGPIIIPESKNFVLTPIAPHNLNARPLVISDDKKVEISVNGRENEYLISVDSNIYSVPIDLTIIVQKASRFLKMVEFNEDSYLKVLREKLLWGKDKRTKQ
ncbi:MAG: NAD kinase [Flavobacteriaceae bacterium]|nr:NAD kinase [Flavobacteriaceae bacterium]MCH1485199.1 NAD kinase [Flavobacteriaceae bacterium]